MEGKRENKKSKRMECDGNERKAGDRRVKRKGENGLREWKKWMKVV